MAKITAVIDIGSNSVRMVVFERTSRFGFHLLQETKSKVRISEGAYEKAGQLQSAAMQRAIAALAEFLSIARSHKASKVLCVATSAVRDAPNRAEFLRSVQKELGLSIKVIDGQKEAYFGALAARNLLPIRDAVTLDIGGGSTELALIQDGEIKELISLELGTVRLKELLFDKDVDYQKMIEFVSLETAKLPPSFRAKTLIGIGGTSRAISTAIMEIEKYPIDTLHGFSFSLDDRIEFFDKLIGAKVQKLKGLKIKPERFDVIREGALILRSIVAAVNAKEMMASGAGVREGVYLADLLRNQNHKFPQNFNPSVRSLLDRFGGKETDSLHLRSTALALFDVLLPIHKISPEYKKHLASAARLCNIGTALSFYSHRYHDYYFILNSLDYGYTHAEKTLIASLTLFCGKKLADEDSVPHFELISLDILSFRWLAFMLSLSEAINSDKSAPKVEFSYKSGVLSVGSDAKLYLAKEAVKALPRPIDMRVEFSSLKLIV